MTDAATIVAARRRSRPRPADERGADSSRRAVSWRSASTSSSPGPGRESGCARRARSMSGLLLLGGLMTRELVLADNVAAELLGPGDLVRPWQAAGPERLVPYEIRWTALERTELAILDRRFAALLPRYPQVNAMLIDRLTERSQRLVADAVDLPAQRRRPAPADALLAPGGALGPRDAGRCGRSRRRPASGARAAGRRAPADGVERARPALRPRGGGARAGRRLAADRRAGRDADGRGRADRPAAPLQRRRRARRGRTGRRARRHRADRRAHRGAAARCGLDRERLARGRSPRSRSRRGS